ncbi:bile acid:sodium symporter family protein [Lederbergia wuyishanensis]|uniref:Na+-dependent transporter n=1 Tax=Lederbergia wuyishanensis TaxID=1347903 RepID=A0ABU0D982_9BACI|nr:bile acid:sodium symporter family protein [Lederbergia wuyishanensis]MCJ8009485.1 bile acid:sodium symporter family protein [Lederbergia wuyishanensis]MDQ0344905.1 putative Na+-dependent transporter [Lederbergia wuyishanensis]
MLNRTNAFLQHWMPYLTPISVVLGVTIFSSLSSISYVVKWVFAFISFASCIGLNVKELRTTLTKPLPVIIGMLIIQGVLPFIAFVVGKALFNDDPYIIIGFVLAFTIPTGVITLMWVSIYGGNRAVTLAIILVNTLLSPILVPFTLNILVGAQVEMDIAGLMIGLLIMVVIPSLLGLLANQLLKNKHTSILSSKLAPFSKMAIFLVILINSAVVAPFFKQMDGKTIILAIIVFLMACFAYVTGFVIAKLFKWDDSVAISLMYNSGMRNTGVGAALAVSYFPASVAFPTVTAVLFQQFLASMAGKIISKYVEKKQKKIVLLQRNNIIMTKQKTF